MGRTDHDDRHRGGRAADALQLAAALIACDEQPSLPPFVALDHRLADAARREGFRVLPPA